MSEIINIHNKGCFKSGYFIMNPDRTREKWENKDELFVTLPYEHSLKDKIIKLIREAKISLKICSFILTDMEIFHEIEDVLQKQNVAVFILTQLDYSHLSSSLLSEEENTENMRQTHLDIINRLSTKGAHIRAAKNAHAKFIVSDRSRALLMSANITTPSLTLNAESGIFLNDESTINHLDRLFDIVYQYETEYTKFIKAGPDKQFVVSRQKEKSEKLFNYPVQTQLRFTFDDIQQSLYQELVNIIQQATSEVIISTYSIVGLERLPELTSAIQNKIAEGVTIKIFSRGMNYRQDHINGCTKLSELGCSIYGDVYNHSKGIFTKGRCMIFTANIDGNHGLTGGFEVGTVLTGMQADHLESFIKWQIDSAPYRFVVSPLKKELFNQYAFYCRQKKIQPFELSENICISLTAQDETLLKALETMPCYIKAKNKEITQIQIGEYHYLAEYKDNTIFMKGRVKKLNFQMEAYLLTYNNMTITYK